MNNQKGFINLEESAIRLAAAGIVVGAVFTLIGLWLVG